VIAAPPPDCHSQSVCVSAAYRDVYELGGMLRQVNLDGSPRNLSRAAIARLGAHVTEIAQDGLISIYKTSVAKLTFGPNTVYYTKTCAQGRICKYAWAWSKAVDLDCTVYLRALTVETRSASALKRAEANVWIGNRAGDYIPISRLAETHGLRPATYQRRFGDPIEPNCPQPKQYEESE